MRILVLDNYDSFTWNLVQFLGGLGAEPEVRRNDELTVQQAVGLAPAAFVISPGPCDPVRAGISVPLVRAAAAARIPLLGVCLGHQAIAEALGGQVVRAGRLMHGKVAAVAHDGRGCFVGLPDPLEVMRYHSLVVRADSLPRELEVAAWSADRAPGEEVMAVRHRTLPIHGVQFHPESVATPSGMQLLANFVASLRG
ncbi:MAG: anthranilate synthase component II [Gemmatimonadales bacterium]